MLNDFNSLLYTSRVPFVNAGDELCLLPLDNMIRFAGMLDDRGLVILSPPAMGLEFAVSGRKISNIHFATFAGNLVYARS